MLPAVQVDVWYDFELNIYKSGKIEILEYSSDASGIEWENSIIWVVSGIVCYCGDINEWNQEKHVSEKPIKSGRWLDLKALAMQFPEKLWRDQLGKMLGWTVLNAKAWEMMATVIQQLSKASVFWSSEGSNCGHLLLFAIGADDGPSDKVKGMLLAYIAFGSMLSSSDRMLLNDKGNDHCKRFKLVPTIVGDNIRTEEATCRLGEFDGWKSTGADDIESSGVRQFRLWQSIL
jgi:hypothetical protein